MSLVDTLKDKLNGVAKEEDKKAAQVKLGVAMNHLSEEKIVPNPIDYTYEFTHVVTADDLKFELSMDKTMHPKEKYKGTIYEKDERIGKIIEKDGKFEFENTSNNKESVFYKKINKAFDSSPEITKKYEEVLGSGKADSYLSAGKLKERTRNFKFRVDKENHLKEEVSERIQDKIMIALNDFSRLSKEPSFDFNKDETKLVSTSGEYRFEGSKYRRDNSPGEVFYSTTIKKDNETIAQVVDDENTLSFTERYRNSDDVQKVEQSLDGIPGLTERYNEAIKNGEIAKYRNPKHLKEKIDSVAQAKKEVVSKKIDMLEKGELKIEKSTRNKLNQQGISR